MKSWTFIYVIGAAQGFVLAIALFRKKVNIQSNRILSVWLMLMAMDLALKTIYLSDPNTPLLQTYTLIIFFPYLYGSLFYLYARTLTQNKPLNYRDVIHFSGFILMAGVNYQWILNPWDNGPLLYGIFELSLYFYSVSYVVAGIVVINNYRKNLSQQQSNTDGIDLAWLGVMAYSQIVIWLVAITQSLTQIKYYNHWVIYIVIAIWITVLGYMGLTQENVQPLNDLAKPNAASVDEGRFDEVDQKLQDLMNNDKLFLEPSLTIGELAKTSRYPEYLISLVINRKYHCTFREYINKLRVEAAQRMLKDLHNDNSILAIAYDSGFVSKSTFNNAFKRITGQTPSSFRQQHRSADVIGS